ncbi:hypothetical protein OE749_07855 [Aestuariibacter sp. AA17]|uniref:Uncharacterized protein n=1 Tax=Fluctibacter corallii TaxID=2984329 RepID=A0ABT3A7F6_9ALTE|nr:hypothetical protein [Aestuariibacter sp. AA17]MCV2884606.1 hypothetical protein [Aestuariibacter sp. AA17]
MKLTHIAMVLGTTLFAATQVNAHSIKSDVDGSKKQAFDITNASASTDGRLTTFMMEVAGVAGSEKPKAIGKLAGAKVESYVWPTSLDPEVVGFDKKSGILALAITAHPDFDDTPLFDEDGDGNPANDGADWHSHWVVLTEEKACGAGLKVRDVSPGVDLLPATAPMLPIALDSPGMSPILDGKIAKITVPVKDTEMVSFDAVTAELMVHAEGKAPLLCVTGVHDVASGDLSLPGKIMRSE